MQVYTYQVARRGSPTTRSDLSQHATFQRTNRASNVCLRYLVPGSVLRRADIRIISYLRGKQLEVFFLHVERYAGVVHQGHTELGQVRRRHAQSIRAGGSGVGHSSEGCRGSCRLQRYSPRKRHHEARRSVHRRQGTAKRRDSPHGLDVPCILFCTW